MRRWLMIVLFASFAGPVAAETFIDPRADGTSAAVVVPDHLPLLHTSQLASADTKLPTDARIALLFEEMGKLLKEHGSGLDRVVKINAVLDRPETAPVLADVMARYSRGPGKPALCIVVGGTVAIDAVATLPEQPELASVRVTKTAAILPTGTRLWVSGQAEAGGGDLAKATRLTMESLRHTLAFLKLKNDAVVQLKAFVNPMSERDVARRVIEEFFGDRPVPPIVFVEWQNKNSIEIELIAHGGRERAGWPLEFLTPPELKASPVYSRVARVNYGPLIYVSGLHPTSASEAEKEIVDVFEQLGKILAKAGSDYRHLAKATYYVTDMATTQKMRELRPRWYDPARPPAASLAPTAGTGCPGTHVTLDMIAVPAPDKQINDYGRPGLGHGLTEAQANEGWIALFDGKTTTGWKDARIENGCLVAGTSTLVFGPCEYIIDYGKEGQLAWDDWELGKPMTPTPLKILPGGAASKVLMRPLKLKPLLNGRNLDGWKAIYHPRLPESSRPTWQVESGILHAVGGPGALEYQGEKLGDFVLQAKVKTRLRHSNGGLFLRAIPGDFMNGYEAQIYNRCTAGDVQRPALWATGAIDDRQNARLLVSRDGIPFTMTVIAQGPHLATWVNGQQTVDWIDTRPPHVNPRQGLRLEPGVLQLQAHDAATDEEFHFIRARKW